jgi:hypothetical protein
VSVVVVVNVVLVNTSVDWSTLLMTADRMMNTLMFSVTDSLDRSAQKLSASLSKSRDHRDDDLSSEQFEHRNPALSSDLKRPYLLRKTRLNETHRSSWYIASPAHVNNDFQSDYSAWCSLEISLLLQYFPFRLGVKTSLRNYLFC